jgi:hypothetical protein
MHPSPAGLMVATLSRPPSRARRLDGMISDLPHSSGRDGVPVDPAAAPVPAALEPEAHDGYRAAARWTGIRYRQAVHDGAAAVAAYHAGYLDGLRAAAEGRTPEPGAAAALVGDGEGESAPDDHDDGPAAPGSGAAAAAPSAEALEERARAEGYADGLRWREPARRGGLVRLMLFMTGKSARRFAAEDLMRSPRRVRRMVAYNDVVEDVIRDELLRRLSALKMRD